MPRRGRGPPAAKTSPTGVPPLALTGERTLPDVPEENYWFRRHLAVYEWIAERVAGLRVADLACGEGYGSDVLAQTRRRGRRRRRQPRGARARAAALPAPEPALRARPGRVLRRPVRRDRLPADDRAHPGPRGAARRLRAGGRGQLRLDPEPADARAARAPRSRTTPGTCASTRPPSTASCSSRTSREVEIYGVFHARKLRAARARDRRRAGTASTRRCGSRSRSTTGSCRRSPPSDFAIRPAAECDLDRGARLPRRLPAMSDRGPGGRPRARPPQPHALRRGLRHLSVRRGVAVRRGDPLLRRLCSTSPTG